VEGCSKLACGIFCDQLGRRVDAGLRNTGNRVVSMIRQAVAHRCPGFGAILPQRGALAEGGAELLQQGTQEEL
jgi:hypothetical protein